VTYESHITFTPDAPEEEALVKLLGKQLSWPFSKIDGDPHLGEGVKRYLTRYPRGEGS